MRVVLVLALSATALAAGCERKAEPKASPARAAAAADTPLSFAQKSADAEVSLTLAPGLKSHPALHQTLYDRESAALSKFAAGAKDERAAIGMDLPPHTSEIAWSVSAETPRLLSLVREASEYTGGAHPNSATTALLWDKQAEREVPLAAVFPTAATHPALERELCTALKREKAKRGGVELTGDTWSCPRWKDVQLALAPAPTKRAATGVTALFSPYDVGPYAEGAYAVTLPASAVRAAVAPAYQAEFAG